MSFATDFGPLTPSNIRSRWRDYVRLHLDQAAELEAAWDAMGDPIAARDLGAAMSAPHGRVCHFFALLRYDIGDTEQDGAEHTAEARASAARIAAHRRGEAPDWGPGGKRERWT